MKRFVLSLLTLASLSMVGAQPAGERRFVAHSDVAEQVQSVFNGLETYSARFQISTTEGSRSQQLSGRVYYMKPGKVRYEFDQPAGNLIVSDGRTMWFYIRRLNAVGRQDLSLDRRNENNRPIFDEDPLTGLTRLFRKYHYHFDAPDQPRAIDGRRFFVLDLEQREKIGGYETMRLFIDPQSYLIQRAEGADSYGKRSVITFSDIALNPPLAGKLFQYEPPEGARVVPNPLVREE